MLENEIWETIRALNKTWTGGDIGDLPKFFHEDIVVISPVSERRIEGKDACVAAWTRFVDNCAVKEWKETDPKVQVYGDAAVVTYYYEISFESQGQLRTEKGRDMFFMVRNGERWLAVADQFSSFPLV